MEGAGLSMRVVYRSSDGFTRRKAVYYVKKQNHSNEQVSNGYTIQLPTFFK